jgi:hypothetical protein
LSQYACSNTSTRKREDLGDPTSAGTDLYLKGGYYMDNDMRAVRSYRVSRQHFLLDGTQATSKTFPVLLGHAWESICKTLDVMLGHYDKHTIADRRGLSTEHG